MCARRLLSGNSQIGSGLQAQMSRATPKGCVNMSAFQTLQGKRPHPLPEVHCGGMGIQEAFLAQGRPSLWGKAKAPTGTVAPCCAQTETPKS